MRGFSTVSRANHEFLRQEFHVKFIIPYCQVNPIEMSLRNISPSSSITNQLTRITVTMTKPFAFSIFQAACRHLPVAIGTATVENGPGVPQTIRNRSNYL